MSLPDDVFVNMGLLSFVHIGNHPKLRRLPSFDGLTRLTSMTLAKVLRLEAFPSFDALANLRTLVVVVCPLVQTIPDMAPLRSLQLFVTVGRGLYCCNGFWTPCDLSHWMGQCDFVWGFPAAKCLPPNRTDNLMTAATRAAFERFAIGDCSNVFMPAALFEDMTATKVALCGGTMYKQCQVGGRTGMCYNWRMMAVACVVDEQIISMRRMQITTGAGDRCDSRVEAWLGCRPTEVAERGNDASNDGCVNAQTVATV